MNSLEQIINYAHKNDVPIMKDEGIEFICKYINENNVRSILEIGTAIGFSAIKFAQVSPNVKVTSIEVDIDRHIQAKQNVKDMALENRIELIFMDALEFKTEQKFDLIFIDAAKAQYINFFEKFKNNLNPSGAILSDNLFFHGIVNDMSLTRNYSTIKLVRKIKKYVAFLKSNPEFNTEFLNIGDGVSISKKNIEYKDLKFVELKNIYEDAAKKICELYQTKNFIDYIEQQLEYKNYFYYVDEFSIFGFVNFNILSEEILVKHFALDSKSPIDEKMFLKYMIKFFRNLCDAKNIHKITFSATCDFFEELGVEKNAQNQYEIKL